MKIRNRTRQQVHFAGIYLAAHETATVGDDVYEGWVAANRTHAHYLLDHFVVVEPDDPSPAEPLPTGGEETSQPTETDRLVDLAKRAIPHIRDFTARGLPNTAALSQHTGEKITSDIRDQAWAEHQAETAAADED